MTVNLYITKNTVGGKYAGIALLEFSGRKKAFAKCFSTSIAFDDLFASGINCLKMPCDVELFTDYKEFDVNCAVMRENVNGKHQIKFKQKQGSETLDWLKFVCYEIALNQGIDDFLMKEAVSEVLK